VLAGVGLAGLASAVSACGLGGGGDNTGFSAVCTHEGCTVDQVSNGSIDCPCHGSQFSVKDGSVVSGPAPSPLPAAAIKITGTSIELG